MKKIVGLILLVVLIIGTSALVFAESDEPDCVLDQDTWEEMLIVKEKYLMEQEKNGFLKEGEATKIIASLKDRENLGVMRGLGFGSWLRNQEDLGDLYNKMPHQGFRGGNGNLTFEEMQEKRGNFSCGRNFEDGENFRPARQFRFQSTDTAE